MIKYGKKNNMTISKTEELKYNKLKITLLNEINEMKKKITLWGIELNKYQYINKYDLDISDENLKKKIEKWKFKFKKINLQ